MKKLIFSLSIALSLLILLQLGSSFSAEAQSGKFISGKVVDNDNSPLVGANVRILGPKEKLLVGATTNGNGEFSLRFALKGTYTLRITYVGYKTYEQTIHTPLKKPLGAIKLSSDGELLSSVVVEGKALDVQIKGDTLVFNASAYKPSETATLEDLIKRLPGAVVDENGTITINGKKIEKLLVDGKEFFVGDPTVATKNLPANAIKSLEMLDRESDQSRMTGFSDGNEETVLNLSFKDHYKKGLFGSIYGGYGTKNRYDAKASINNFQGANRQTVVAGSNNTNDRGNSELEQQRRGRPQRAKEGITTSINVAADISQELGKTDIQGNGMYGYSDKNIQRKSKEQLINNHTGGSLFTESESNSRDFGNKAKLYARIEIKPNSRHSIVLRPQLKYKMRSSYGNEEAETKDQNQLGINSLKSFTTGKDQSLQIGVSGDYAIQLNKVGRLLTFRAEAFYNGREENAFSQSSLKLIQENKTEETQYNLIDKSKIANTVLQTTWVEPLKRNYYIQAMLQWSYMARGVEHSFYLPDGSNGYTQRDQKLSGDFTNKLHSVRASLNFQKREKTYNITVGLGLSPNIMNTDSPLIQGGRYTLTQLYFMPSLRIGYNPSSTTSLQAWYNAYGDMPNVEYMIPFSDPSNPLLVKEGNLALKPSFNHNFRGFFRHFNPKSRVAYNLYFHARYSQNAVVQKQQLDPSTGKRKATFVNVDGIGFGGIFANVTMPIFNPFFSLNLGLMAMHNRSIGFINEEKNDANTLQLTPQLSLSFVRGPLYIRIKGDGGVNYTLNSLAVAPNARVWDYSAGLDGNYTFPFGLTVETDFAFKGNYGYADTFKRKDWIWNASLAYSFLKSKAATVRLKLYDILGNETGIAHNAGAFSISESNVNVLGRYFMVHFIYRFGTPQGEGRGNSHGRDPYGRQGGAHRSGRF